MMITYCGDCGIALRQDDFARGVARTLDHAPYCGACIARKEPGPASERPRPRRRERRRRPLTRMIR